MSKTIVQIERSIQQEANSLVKGRTETVIFAYRMAQQAMLTDNFAPEELDPQVRQFFKSNVPVSPYVEQPQMIKQSSQERMQPAAHLATQEVTPKPTETILDSEVNPIHEQALSDLEAKREAVNSSSVSADELRAYLNSR